MPMTYDHIDPAEREIMRVKATGLGDTSLLDDQDALVSEQQLVVLQLRRAISNEHATSALPNGADPEATEHASQVGLLDQAVANALAIRDRIVAVTSTDVSDVAQPILDANRAQAEANYSDAEWALANTPGLTQERQDALQLRCDRAEREAAVIDGWGA